MMMSVHHGCPRHALKSKCENVIIVEIGGKDQA